VGSGSSANNFGSLNLLKGPPTTLVVFSGAGALDCALSLAQSSIAWLIAI